MGVLRGIRSLQNNSSGPAGGYSAGPALFLRKVSRDWFRGALLVLVAVATTELACAQEWKRLGPPGGMVLSLAAAADGTVFLGTADGHVFASADRGEHWELRGRVGGRLDGIVQRMVADGAHAQRVLAAVWFRNAAGGGVFESGDGGQHWKLAGLGDEAVRTLEQSASEPGVWVAGTRRGLFRSRDDAKSWERITEPNDPELQNVDSLAIDPRDAETIYVGTYHLPWKTSDGGKTWQPIAAGMIDDSDIMSLRIDARNPRRVFSSACSGIYRSDDGGATWTKLQGIPYSSRRTQQIAQDPVDPRRLYAATTEGLWATSDYGETWKRVTTRETNANAVVVLGGEKGNRMLAGFDAQGILRSDDGGNTIVESNEGFSHRVVFGLAVESADTRRLLARVQGFGSGALVESDDEGKTWVDFPSAFQGKTVARIFAAPSGWWAAFAEGGAARFDAEKRQWAEIPFHEVTLVRARASRGSSGKQTVRQVRLLKAHVSSIIELGNDVFASSNEGLWKEDSGRGDFRRVVAKNLPLAITFLSGAVSSGAGIESLLAIAGEAVWSSDGRDAAWSRVPLPPESGTPLWLVDHPWHGTVLRLLGTRNGVFSHESQKGWKQLSNGLPAISSAPPAFSETICLLNMSNGGTYASEGSLRVWRRIEKDGVQAAANAIVWIGGEKFVLATTSEGVLEWESGRKSGAKETRPR
jgi:photosystem II stability/assembly factor-like uncharacterized protein